MVQRGIVVVMTTKAGGGKIDESNRKKTDQCKRQLLTGSCNNKLKWNAAKVDCKMIFIRVTSSLIFSNALACAL